MKILYYNWTPLGVKGVGGGVAVYMNNFLQHFSDIKFPIQTFFLSSGYFYDHKSEQSYIREEEPIYNTRVFSIVNSSVVAPLVCSISSLKRQFVAKDIISLFDGFILKYGPFDIIHFQSFEGISTKVLELKNKYPQTKFLHSIHDYGIFCPNVRFWNYQQENCIVTRKPRLCARCTYEHNIQPFYFQILNRPCSHREMANNVLPRSIVHKISKKLRKVLLKYFDTSKKFFEYKRQNINLINQYSDGELCVSKRVAEIARKEGIDSNKIYVDYIGTKVAETSMGHCQTDVDTPNLTILYMGYANVEKGFYKLIETLEKFTKDEAKNIRIKFAAQIKDISILDKIKEIFDDVVVYQGYVKDEIPLIIKDVNLGIVPPLWEDNLPQVALEMIAYGIPIITSVNGGAQELNSHPAFKFEDNVDLKEKILNIQSNRQLLVDYWKHSVTLTTMHQHLLNLMRIYELSK